MYSLYVRLIEEFERCILTYFAFHWSKASLVISQAMDAESMKKPKLKGLIMAATRKQRFERVSNDLKVTRAFSTLVEEMRAIGRGQDLDESQCTDVMVPMALSERSPVLLLMGGGMGAGKSTVAKDILKEPFWAGAKANAVVVEADAFKLQGLNSRGHHDEMLQTAELLIAWKDGENKLLIEPEEYRCLLNVSDMNADADSIYDELYEHPGRITEPGSVWKEIVMLPSRSALQSYLKTTIQNIHQNS